MNPTKEGELFVNEYGDFDFTSRTINGTRATCIRKSVRGADGTLAWRDLPATAGDYAEVDGARHARRDRAAAAIPTGADSSATIANQSKEPMHQTYAATVGCEPQPDESETLLAEAMRAQNEASAARLGERTGRLVNAPQEDATSLLIAAMRERNGNG